MNFKQHRNYGITIALAASLSYCLFFTILYYFQSGSVDFSWSLFVYCLFLFAVVFGGSQFPDLDTDSIPSRWVARFLIICWIVVFLSENSRFPPITYELQWKPVGVLSLIFAVAKSGKHRGITHALIWFPALLITSIYSGNHFIAAFAVGLGVHYYCDSINPWKWKNWI